MHEVIVVNDGSTDRTLEIAQCYDYLHLISQENKGLSAARNVGPGRQLAKLLLILTLTVCRSDRLTYMVAKFLSSGLCRRSELSSPEDSLIPSCVAVARVDRPLSDEVAEHIPGCTWPSPRGSRGSWRL